MLNSREKELIVYLQKKNDWVKSIQIAQELAVSERMIRRYVKNINELPGLIYSIESSKRGYKLKVKIKDELESFPTDTKLISKKGRIKFILFRLLDSSNTELTSYGLAEELFVSEYTIENNLVSIRKIIKKYSLTVKKKYGNLYIFGEEKNKRKLMFDLICEEIQDNSFFGNYTTGLYMDISILEIKDVIKNSLDKNNLYGSNEIIQKLSIYTFVVFYRVARGDNIRNSELKCIDSTEFNVVSFIVQKLEKYTSTKLDPMEINDITLMFLGNLTSKLYDENSLEEILKESENTDIFSIETMIDEVERCYRVCLNNDKFKYYLLVLLKNVKERQLQLSNPVNSIIDNAKESSPLIHEISLFIKDKVYNYLNLKLTDYDIEYLMSYIGIFSNINKESKPKINTVLLCPDYYPYSDKMFNLFTEIFEDELYIVGTFNEICEVNELLESVDLIVSLYDRQISNYIPMINISIFPSYIDILNVRKEIVRIQQGNNKAILSKYIDEFLPEDSLYVAPKETKEMIEVIQFLSTKFIQSKVVDKNFYYMLTKFNPLLDVVYADRLAIPHCIQYTANKTQISLLINKEGIEWNGHCIQFVFLVAINDSDRPFFNNFLELVVNEVANSDKWDKFLKVTSKEELIQLIKE